MPDLSTQFRAAGSSWRLTYNFGDVVVERWDPFEQEWVIVPLAAYSHLESVCREIATFAAGFEAGLKGSEQ